MTTEQLKEIHQEQNDIFDELVMQERMLVIANENLQSCKKMFGYESPTLKSAYNEVEKEIQVLTTRYQSNARKIVG